MSVGYFILRKSVCNKKRKPIVYSTLSLRNIDHFRLQIDQLEFIGGRLTST